MTADLAHTDPDTGTWGEPFGGLFGNGVLPRVLQQLVADPESDYHPNELAELTGSSGPAVRAALRTLRGIDFIANVGTSERRPIYRVAPDSRRLRALTFLAYAWSDDRDRTRAMDEAVSAYYQTEVPETQSSSTVEIRMVEVRLTGEAGETAFRRIAAAADMPIGTWAPVVGGNASA